MAKNRAYKPRRCSERWLDGDCPAGVLAIFDNPNFTDRYLVLYSEPYGDPKDPRGPYLWGRGMSANPTHPQGVGMSVELTVHAARAYRYREKHRYAKWSNLPESVRACVRNDLQKED